MICRDYPPSKIVVPEVSETVLPRWDVIKAIDGANLNELIYINAPYGCGKTLAVISWLREYKQDAAWVSISQGDNSPVTLWPLLAASILRFAGEQDKANSIIQDTHSDDSALSLLNETLIRVSPPLTNRILIIDNCHILRDTKVLDEIRVIIYNMLGCWKVIFIGRGELPSVFNDLILKKCLRQITLNELSFTQEEIADYFHLNGNAVVKQDLFRIKDETEGWPAALNAILLAPHNGIIEYNFTARSYVMGYFEEEIWNPLDEMTKTFLMRTAILDKLTPSICHYLTEIEETSLVLSKLYAGGIFLTKLEEFNSYSYQRVFKEFLLHKLSTSGIDVNGMYVKVGWWLYERDESIPALLCFYKAGNICGINQAFKKVRPANIGMDKFIAACSCLMRLKVEDLKEYPEVAARIALLFFVTNNIEEFKRIFNTTLDWLKPGVLMLSPESYSDFSWEVGWLRYVNPDENILYNGEFEKWANVGKTFPNMLESDRSRASVLRFPSVLRGGRDYSVNVYDTEKYYEMICKTGVIIDEDALFIIDLIMAEIAYEREEFSKSEDIINKIIPAIEMAKQSELYFVSIVLLVKILRATNKPKEINKLIERLGSIIISNNHYYLLPNFHAFELRNRLLNGILGTTEIFGNENKPYEDKTYFYLIYRKITFVRALLSESKYIEANLILANLDLMCRSYKRNADLIEINILRSISEYGLEHYNAAYERIMEALDSGRKCGFIRIFSDEAESILPVLNLVRKKVSDIDDYVENIIISCKKMLPCVVVKSGANVLLSKAETEVYKLLATSMSRKEIAKARNVTLSTIDSQINSLYQKLGVKDRVSAVALKINTEH